MLQEAAITERTKVLAGELGQIYLAEIDLPFSMATNQIFAVDAAKMDQEAPPVQTMLLFTPISSSLSDRRILIVRRHSVLQSRPLPEMLRSTLVKRVDCVHAEVDPKRNREGGTPVRSRSSLLNH